MTKQVWQLDRFTPPPSVPPHPHFAPQPAPPPSSSSRRPHVMRADEEREWLLMLRAQPWRRQEAPPPPPPLPRLPATPRDQLLRDVAPLSSLRVPLEHELRSARHTPLPTIDHAQDATSTAMRFLLRSPPHVPPLHREDRRVDAYPPHHGSALLGLRPWAASAAPPLCPQPFSMAGSLAPRLDRHRIAFVKSNAAPPSSTCSTPSNTSATTMGVSRSPHADSEHTWAPHQQAEPRPGSTPTPAMGHPLHDAFLPTHWAESMPTERAHASDTKHSVRRSARPVAAALAATLDAQTGATGAAGSSSDATPTPTKKKKKRTPRLCTTPGCDKLVVDHGVCIRHGGGKRCNVEGCTCRAQNKGLCWKHGGYTICKIEGCDKRAKSRGMCWSHGGGTQCKNDGCEKIAVSRGRCWAHGGGKRCKVLECHKPAAVRMDDYCTEHHKKNRQQLQDPQPPRRRELDPLHRYDDLQGMRDPRPRR